MNIGSSNQDLILTDRKFIKMLVGYLGVKSTVDDRMDQVIKNRSTSDRKIQH